MTSMAARGVLLATEPFASDALVPLARAIEGRGYESLWLPELFGREPFATAGFLLGCTERLALGTAIANVYARDAHAMAQAQRSLAELSGGRFLLGLGVSNASLNSARGHAWQPPLAKMAAYLDAMSAARLDGPVAPASATYVAAHGPKLQALGAGRADGIITYLMPPEHTMRARAHIGPAAALNAVAFFLAETDAANARRRARAALGMYVRLDYYHREWRKLGFVDADFADGGSDRLIDTLVAWGDERALQARFAAYERAGASRIIVLPLGLRTREGLDMRVLDALAPGGG
jgi:probable F420-dependent oxidoreductase